MNQQVRKGQAPKSVHRVDQGKIEFEKDHIHFKDDRILNSDGTWRGDRGRTLTTKEKVWIEENNWEIPQE